MFLDTRLDKLCSSIKSLGKRISTDNTASRLRSAAFRICVGSPRHGPQSRYLPEATCVRTGVLDEDYFTNGMLTLVDRATQSRGGVVGIGAGRSPEVFGAHVKGDARGEPCAHRQRRLHPRTTWTSTHLKRPALASVAGARGCPARASNPRTDAVDNPPSESIELGLPNGTS